MADDGFLSRWSRLKQERREEAPGEEQAAGQAREVGSLEPPAEAGHTAEPEEVDPAQLPDIDSLTEQSDFTPFLREGVPEALRQRALRKLWRLNPVFANLDGLNDYDQDFSDAATVVKGLKTLYQVGRGIGLPPADAPTEDEVAARSAEQPQGRAEPQGDFRQEEALEAGNPPSEPAHDLSNPPASGDSDEAAALERSHEAQAVLTDDTSVGREQAPVAGPRPAGKGTSQADAVRRRWGRFGEA